MQQCALGLAWHVPFVSPASILQSGTMHGPPMCGQSESLVQQPRIGKCEMMPVAGSQTSVVHGLRSFLSMSTNLHCPSQQSGTTHLLLHVGQFSFV